MINIDQAHLFKILFPTFIKVSFSNFDNRLIYKIIIILFIIVPSFDLLLLLSS
jgi:hypothetical protein